MPRCCVASRRRPRSSARWCSGRAPRVIRGRRGTASSSCTSSRPTTPPPPPLPPTRMPSSPALRQPEPVARPVTRAAVITHGVATTIGNGLMRLARVAERCGVELVVPEIECRKHQLHEGPWRVMDEYDPESTDLILVLGGDGTTLRALHRSLD